MIPLSTHSYILKNIDVKKFWKNLDDITFGQSLNPEFGYTTQYWGDFDNVFDGRKTGNAFSVYLYRPITESFRTEILAKGTVREWENGIKINIKYEIPFWSILVLILFGSLIMFSVWISYSKVVSIVLISIILLIYILIINSNHNDVKREISSQFNNFINKP